MVSRIQITTLAAVAALFFTSNSAVADTTLVSYNFDYDVLDSGPDTYQIFQHKNAKAEISAEYASGGYASAHLTDEAKDGDFVELQGYFPEQQTGVVHFRFKFLIASPNNLFNFALVGRERYQLSPLGINFWLIYEDGWLKHRSDSIPRKLFQPNLYEWYAVDAALNLDTGLYSLQIAGESGGTAVKLDNQKFANGSSKAYSLKEYSFIGDLQDSQPADFYLDDISIVTSVSTKVAPLVAPGRRKYFVEMWDDYHRELQGKLQCLPAKGIEDFGIYSREYESLKTIGKLDVLYGLIRLNPRVPKAEEWQSSDELSAIVDWLTACDALDKKEFGKARASIARAIAKKSTAYIYQLTSLIVDAASATNLNASYSRAYSLPQQGNDVRNMIALSMIAFHLNRYDDTHHAQSVNAALASLDRLSGNVAAQLHEVGMSALGRDYIGRLQRYVPKGGEQPLEWMLVLEQQYYAYLWQGNYRDATALVNRVVAKLAKHSIEPGIWLERKADCAYLNRDLETALDLYNIQVERSLGSVLKMADLYHMQGDLASEKSLRESIYRNFSRK